MRRRLPKCVQRPFLRTEQLATETSARAIEGKFAGLDDLVIQFGDTPEGSAFVNAWFNARKVVNLRTPRRHWATPGDFFDALQATVQKHTSFVA